MDMWCSCRPAQLRQLQIFCAASLARLEVRKMLWLVTASAAAAHLSPLVATMPTPRLARATPPVMQYGGGRDMYDDRDMVRFLMNSPPSHP